MPPDIRNMTSDTHEVPQYFHDSTHYIKPVRWSLEEALEEEGRFFDNPAGFFVGTALLLRSRLAKEGQA